jgi:hypothetical protein
MALSFDEFVCRAADEAGTPSYRDGATLAREGE